MNIKRPHSRGLNDKMKELRKEHQQVIEERFCNGPAYR